MSTEPSVIHDIGYQRYTGPRLGRGAVLGAIYQHGLRAAFGLGRSAKAKIFPWLVIGVALLVAIVVAAVKAQVGVALLTYSQFVDTLTPLLILFVAIVAPELLSRDLRSGVLPLYFSRPLPAADYVAAKFAALLSAIWLLLGVPQLIMFLGGVLTTTKGMSGVWDEVTAVAPALAYSLLWAVVLASVSLLVASATGKRAFAAGGIVAVFLMTIPVVAALNQLPSEAARSLAGIASPTILVGGVGSWLLPGAPSGYDVGEYGPVYGIAAVTLIAACLLALLARYRKVAAS